MSDHKLNATFKASERYDAPWLTIGSNDPQELHNLVAQFAGVDTGLDTAAVIVAAATKLQAVWTAKDTLGATVVPSQQPPAQQPAPVGPATAFISGQAQQAAPQAQPQAAPAQQAQAPGVSCIHGPMTRRTGTSAKGPWGGYFCPQPKGAPDQCKPVWDQKG